MSFEFPKPVPRSRCHSSDSDYDFESDYDENHYELMDSAEHDYDELLIRLSLYVFNRLSPRDQRERVEEIRQNVNESDEASRLTSFAELFKKLNFSQQKRFLSKVAKKFKRERRLGELMSWFQRLDAKHQQQVIEKIVPVTPENLRNPGETEEELRLRRFTQLSRDYTDHVCKLVVAWKSDQEETSDNENGSDCFSEFFLGFSIVWFQGQSSRSQDLLIEQLSSGVTSSVVIENRLPHESEEDFKLRRFTELCKQVVDFGVQEKFLDNAGNKLERWQHHYCSRLIVEPQDSDSAAELLSLLTCFGFSLLSAMYQQKKIDEMSNQVGASPAAAADDEGIRMTRFKELFNRFPVPTRMDLYEELSELLLQEKRYTEAVRFFRGLGSKDQTEMIEKLSGEMMKYRRRDPAELIIEKFSGESEEDFRLRRFKKVCIKYLSIRGDILWPKAYRELVGQGTSEEPSPYASFLFGVSIIWYKARCADYGRNPIHVILFRQVDQFRDHVIEKLPLPEESEEDFRLRRFTESFKRLEFTFQKRIVDYIQDALFRDLGYPVSYITLNCASETPEGRGEFDAEWVRMKLSDLQDQGAAAATTQGATSQAAAGGRVGQPSASASSSINVKRA